MMNVDRLVALKSMSYKSFRKEIARCTDIMEKKSEISAEKSSKR